jgi:aspartate/methionine/tyrosine aminotransferase
MIAGGDFEWQQKPFTYVLEAFPMTNKTLLEFLQKEQQHFSDPDQRSYLFSLQNPQVINLSTAENVLIFDRIKTVFQNSTSFAISDTKYPQPFYGKASVREMTAELLRKTFKLKELNAAHISGVSGASAALECLAFALLSPGDSVLMPTPFWQGFKWCFEQRPGTKIIPVNLTSQNGFELTVDAVKQVYNAANPKPKALVLTNPHNPLGVNYSQQLLEELYSWVLTQTGMHIISDELYCHSQINQPGPDFVSAFALNAYQTNKNRVHIVWGFSKDFGLSGFRAGFIITTSEQVHNHVRSNSSQGISERYGWFSPFGSLQNFMLENLLSAEQGELPSKVMQEYQQKLTYTYEEIQKLFDKVPDIKTHRLTRAAQFFWLDLRAYLDRVPPDQKFTLKDIDLLDYSAVDERENRLSKYMVQEGGVQLLQGQTLSCTEPGFFRLCFTCEEFDKVKQGVNQVIAALEKLPK